MTKYEKTTVEKKSSVENTEVIAKQQFDSARKHINNPTDAKEDIQAKTAIPTTTEDAMRLVWIKAFNENKAPDQKATGLDPYEEIQKAKVDNIYQTIEDDSQLVSSTPLDGQKMVAELRKIRDGLKPSDQPPTIREIAGDLRLIIAMNLIGMKEVVNNAKNNGSVDKADARKLHSRIFGSIGASGGYYLYIRNNIPLDFKESDRTAKRLLAQPTGEFQKALGNFTEELDKVLPWKYKDSAGLAFGAKSSSPPNFDQKLSSDDQKRLEDSYKAVREAGKALSKRLAHIISLGTSIEKWQIMAELKSKL